MTLLRIGKTGTLAALLLAIFAPLPLQAQEADARISVISTPNPVPEHESMQLQITVDSPLSTPVVQPTFDSPDLTVMGAPGLSFMPENGDAGPSTRKKLTFTFVLLPKRVGDFTIRRIQTKVGKNVLSAPDAHIKVVPDDAPRSPQNPAAAEDDESGNPASPAYGGNPFDGSQPASQPHGKVNVPDRFNSDFTIFASLSKPRIYVGEPVVVEYYLYDFGGLRQTEVLKWPTFDGFWKEDLELTTRVAFEDIFVRNQEMRRAFIARYALYGIKPGRIPVDKLGIRGKYVTNDMAVPGMMFGFDLRTGQHYSQDISVEVVPLPEAGRPAKFGGAVGKFALKLEADKLSVAQNTPITFTLTLTGTGNFQAIDSIKLPLPADFELYESTVNGRVATPVGTRQELESKKVFQVIAIPRKAGKFELPAVSWPYFNAEKSSYETLTTNPLTIEVQANENNSTTAANNYLSPGGGPNPGMKPEELRYLKPVSFESHETALDYLRWALWAALGINFILLLRFLRSRSRGIFGLVKNIDRFAEARIMLLQAKGIREAEWQAALEEVVLHTLQILLATNPRGLTKNDLEEIWKARSLPATLFQRMIALLDEIDRNRFSSQKLASTKEMRARFTRETESVLIEASKWKKK